MGYRLNRLDEPVFMAVSKPLLTEFGIHHRLESCVVFSKIVHDLFESARCLVTLINKFKCFILENGQFV